MNKILFSFLFCLILPQISLAYNDQTTHPGLTEQTVRFYNNFTDQKIGKTDMELIIQGSMAEDTPEMNVLNHFYDPQRGMGINNYRPAVEWATAYNTTNKFSWRKNIEKYVKGDKEGALIGLGHVLHLVQDMSVPDHTRNDPHVGEGGIKGWAGTGNSPYEDWAKENKDRQTLNGIASSYYISGNRPRNCASVEECLHGLAAYSNNNYVSPDTIEGSEYQNPQVTKKADGYAYGEDSYFYNEHKLYFSQKQENGKYSNNLFMIDGYRKDYSVLAEYFTRLSKMAILTGARVVEIFITEAENARTAFLEMERKKQEEIAKREADRKEQLAEANWFTRLWYRTSYAATDAVSGVINSLASAGSLIGRTVYNGSAIALNTTWNATGGLTYTAKRVAAISAKKVQKVVVSATQKVILYVKENSSNLMAPAVAYNLPTSLPERKEPVINNSSDFSKLLTILYSSLTPTSNLVDDDQDEGGADNDSHHHGSSNNSNNDEPESPLVEEENTVATTTDEADEESVATTTATSTDPILNTVYESVAPPTIFSAVDITNTTPTTTILFSGTSTPDFIITTDFASTSTSTDALGDWSLALENIPTGTTTIKFYAEPDQAHSSTTISDSVSNTATTTIYTKSDATETTIFVAEAETVNLTVTEPADCEDSFLADRCLINTDEVEMSWSSTLPGLDHYVIQISSEYGTSTTNTIATSSLLTLETDTENVIEIFAVDGVGNESDHILTEVIVYEEPIYISQVYWTSEYFDAEGQAISLYNNTPYDLNLNDFSLSKGDDFFHIDLSGVISGGGDFNLKKIDSGIELSVDQTYDLVLDREGEHLYLKRGEEIINDRFIGVFSPM